MCLHDIEVFNCLLYVTVNTEIRRKSAKMFPRFSADSAKVPDGLPLQIQSQFLLACPYFYMCYFKNPKRRFLVGIT